MTKKDVLDLYHDRIQLAKAKIDEYKALSNRYSLIRLSVFLITIPIFYFLLKTNTFVFAAVILMLSILFVWAVLKQQKYDKLVTEKEALLTINENEISSLESFENLYSDGSHYNIHGHRYMEDLDIFGHRSIYSLINRSKTYAGNQLLNSYLTTLPVKTDVLLRQEAIKEVGQDIEWRQELAVKLFSLENQEKYDVAVMINHYLEMDLDFATRPLLNWYRKLLPLIWILLAYLSWMGNGQAQTTAGLLFLFNLFLAGKFTNQITEIQNKLAVVGSSLSGYIGSIKTVFNKTWNSKLIKSKASKFENQNSELPIAALSELNTIIDHLDFRLNFIIAVLGNGFILWDLSVITRLSKWKEKHKGKIKDIFDYIGFMEAISSLATWAYNHPEYKYPVITDDYLTINAISIEHPLIPKAQNVANDFILHNKDEISIITGSNMSGKSTFLRTIGLNMILSYTGTKVAAQKLEIPIVHLVTYMRIKDALEENVSTFKAELNRISLILSTLKSEEKTFILIDEMLRGTNSKDKLSGSIGLTKKLLTEDTYAMIATHDIKLAEMGEEEPRIANYFFDIDYKEGDLVFDYKIKEGICENFNASFLLNKLGIEC